MTDTDQPKTCVECGLPIPANQLTQATRGPLHCGPAYCREALKADRDRLKSALAESERMVEGLKNALSKQYAPEFLVEFMKQLGRLDFTKRLSGQHTQSKQEARDAFRRGMLKAAEVVGKLADQAHKEMELDAARKFCYCAYEIREAAERGEGG